MENVSLELGERLILQNVNLEFREGAMTGILGANGAGKTTLLRSLAGLLPLAAGRIHFEEVDISTMRRKDIARCVGYLAQDNMVSVPFKADETVMIGRYPYLSRFTPETSDDRRVVDQALKAVDAISIRHRPINEISGGERQRVLLARTLASEAPVLLLDEPFANMDIRHCLDILEILQEQVHSGCSVVISIHDLNLAYRYCDRLILLLQGDVLAHDKTEDVLQPGLIKKAFQVEADIYENHGTGRYILVRSVKDEIEKPK